MATVWSATYAAMWMDIRYTDLKTYTKTMIINFHELFDFASGPYKPATKSKLTFVTIKVEHVQFIRLCRCQKRERRLNAFYRTYVQQRIRLRRQYASYWAYSFKAYFVHIVTKHERDINHEIGYNGPVAIYLPGQVHQFRLNA